MPQAQRYLLLSFTVCLEVHREGLSIKECAQRHAMSGGIDAAQKAYEYGLRRLGLTRPKATITGDEVGIAVQRYEHSGIVDYRMGTPAWFARHLEQERRDDELERVYNND